MARAGTNHKGGRPKGKRSAATLEKEAVLRAFRERAMKHADILFDAQLTLARGQTYLYVIVTDSKGRKERPKLIEDLATIEAYLAEELNGDPNEYYFLTTKDPNNMAADSLLDRAFGRSTQVTEISGKDGAELFKPGAKDIELAHKFEKELKEK